MRIEGSARIAAPRQAVWDALHDPAVLARTLPGCDALEVTGPDAYAATITAGVASVKGTYLGAVSLVDKVEPERYRLRASGAGTPGTVEADALIVLREEDGATTITYEADAVIGGAIGGVGQRMIGGVARRMAGEFFGAVEAVVNGTAPAPSAAAPVPAVPGAAAPAPGAPAVGEVYRRPVAEPAPRRSAEVIIAVVVGAAIALLGVWLGVTIR
jgi:carbon monoxide dehydrogenase subunit G